MKKVFAIALAAIMIVCLSVTAFADYEPAATLGIQVGNMDNGGWGYAEVVEVTAPGTYTLTYDGDARAIDWIVIKSTDDNRDGAAVVETGIPAGTIIRITYLEIDGAVYSFDSGDSYDTKVEFGGGVEVQPLNTWTGNDHIVNRPAEASKVVITFVVDPDNAPADEPEATEPEATEPEATEPEAPEASEPVAPAEASAPAAPAAPATGIALAVVPAIVALAAVAVSKKH